LILSLALVACGPTPPELDITVSRSDAAPALDTLTRLHVLIAPCGQPVIIDQDMPFQADATGKRPVPRLTPNLTPDTPFYVWLQGWAGCTGSCDTIDLTHGDRCTCTPTLTPNQQLIAADGCSTWLTLNASTQTNVAIRLVPHTPGLCPPPESACQM
jgi:hypothetical protein